MTIERAPFGHSDRSGLLLGLSGASLACLGLVAAMLLVGLVYAGIIGFLVASVCSTPLMGVALLHIQGKRAVEWAPIGISTGLRRLRQQGKYVIGSRAARVGELVLPGRLARLRLRVGPSSSPGSGPFAIIEDPIEKTLTIAARVTHPAFLLTDSATRDRRVEAWGRILASLGESPGLVRLQVLERALPDSASGLMDHFAVHGAHGTPAAEHYQELISSAGPAAERHELFLVWSWSRSQLERDIRRAGGGDLGLGTVLAQRVWQVDHAVSSADLSLSWLAPRDIADVIKHAYDPGPSTDSVDGVDPTGAGPEGLLDEWRYLRADSGFHATYRVAEWPRLPMESDFLSPLILTSRVRRAFSLFIEPVSTARSERDIRARKAEHVAEEQTKERIGQVRSQRSEAELEDVLRRESDLVAGHPELRFVALVSVSAGDLDSLDAACGAVEHSAGTAHLELRRLYGQQAAGFAAAALPLGLSVLKGSIVGGWK